MYVSISLILITFPLQLKWKKTNKTTNKKTREAHTEVLVYLLPGLMKPWEVLSLTLHRKSTCFWNTGRISLFLHCSLRGHSRFATSRKDQIRLKIFLQPNYPSTLNWQKFRWGKKKPCNPRNFCCCACVSTSEVKRNLFFRLKIEELALRWTSWNRDQQQNLMLTLVFLKKNKLPYNWYNIIFLMLPF